MELQVMKTKFFHGGFLNPLRGFITLTGLSLLLCTNASAQLLHSASPEKDDTRQGNKQFDKENYSDAEADYKKALDKKNNMPEAMFNLGDAVYKEKRYPEATQQFELSSQTNPDPMIKAKALHNLGNTYMEQRRWEDAVRSYKNALRWNPNDRDTKYNLAYANAMLRQSKNDQKNQDKNNKQDKKDQDKQQQQQQNQKPDQGDNKQQQQQQADNKQQQQKGAAKAQLSKQDADKLLQALEDENQKTNQKVQQKQVHPVNVKILKDW